jgi:hypothetical protein
MIYGPATALHSLRPKRGDVSVTRIRVLLVVAAAAAAVACASSSNSIVVPTRPFTTPDWISEGTGAFRGEGGRRLQGVGVASGIANPMARRKQADAAAQEQLQSGVDALAQALSKMAESGQASAVVTIAHNAAAQVYPIRDRFVTADGDELAVAVLGIDDFRKALHKIEGDEKTRPEMDANVDSAFDQLAPR